MTKGEDSRDSDGQREEKGDHLGNVILMTSSDTDAVRQRVAEQLQIISKTERVDEIASAVTTACCAEDRS